MDADIILFHSRLYVPHIWVGARRPHWRDPRLFVWFITVPWSACGRTGARSRCAQLLANLTVSRSIRYCPPDVCSYITYRAMYKPCHACHFMLYNIKHFQNAIIEEKCTRHTLWRSHGYPEGRPAKNMVRERERRWEDCNSGTSEWPYSKDILSQRGSDWNVFTSQFHIYNMYYIYIICITCITYGVSSRSLLFILSSLSATRLLLLRLYCIYNICITCITYGVSSRSLLFILSSLSANRLLLLRLYCIYNICTTCNTYGVSSRYTQQSVSHKAASVETILYI